MRHIINTKAPPGDVTRWGCSAQRPLFSQNLVERGPKTPIYQEGARRRITHQGRKQIFSSPRGGRQTSGARGKKRQVRPKILHKTTFVGDTPRGACGLVGHTTLAARAARFICRGEIITPSEGGGQQIPPITKTIE